MKKLIIILAIILGSLGVKAQTLRDNITITLGDGSDITALKLRNVLYYMSDSTTRKVDKIIGKGLSTNDFNGTYKTALDGLNNSLDVIRTALNRKLESLNPIISGDVEMGTIGNGVIIKSPNGTRFRITISNSGDIISTSL